MAKNGTPGDNRRHGAVRDRTQVHNPRTNQFVKRNSENGRFMAVKKDGTKFKGVRLEKSNK